VSDITIRFRYNPKTGKRQMVVHYESEEDLLPHEHERDHRAMVEALLGRPIGQDEEIVVERVEKQGSAVVDDQTEGARQSDKTRSGS
jgi:hypothetical protein